MIFLHSFPTTWSVVSNLVGGVEEEEEEEEEDRSGRCRRKMGQLEPIKEEPIDEEDGSKKMKRSSTMKKKMSWAKWQWIKTHISLISSPKKPNNIKILLSVLGCPLSPISTPHPSSSSLLTPLKGISSKAQYIIQQFRGVTQMGKSLKSLYASGNVEVAMVKTAEETGEEVVEDHQRWMTEKGRFVVWEMDPGMWLIELVVSGWKIVAGSDGNTAWRNTPWIGTHAAPGGVRPLRRALQGLNPSTITSIFSTSQYMGEKEMDGQDCFVLLLEADQPTLLARSDHTAKIIKHIMIGYFSQITGLLVHLDDLQLTQIKVPGGVQPIFWETTINSKIQDYKPVDHGILVAHSGRSIVRLAKFEQGIEKQHQETTTMEEEWTIHDITFDIPGLSSDYFIPPEEVRKETS